MMMTMTKITIDDDDNDDMNKYDDDDDAVHDGGEVLDNFEYRKTHILMYGACIHL